jgi:UDP-N-acetylmuramoyl-L-alanyl-D-glutamate--2,6-diaminopimelate ligase
MAKAAQRYAKKIYLTSDNPRDEDPMEIIKDIAEGFSETENVLAVPNRKKAIKVALKELQNDEILVILGKGDEEYQEIKGKKFPFDDRKIVREFLT